MTACTRCGGRLYGADIIARATVCIECERAEVPNPVVGEWELFTTALRKAVRDDLTIHQRDVRPLIRGRINPKHIGQFWKRAKADGLIRDTGRAERSNDVAGRNSHRLEPIYELRRSA